MKEIPLSQGKFALVDDEDYDWLNQWKWSFSNGYAVRAVQIDATNKQLRMHAQILDAPPGFVVDHINRNRSDNRRENLRLVTSRENTRNRVSNVGRSPYKGVAPNKKRWRAYIKNNGKQIRLGTFDTQTEAAQAYNQAAIEIFGEFAQLNQIPNELPEWDEPHKTITTSQFRGVSWDKERQKWEAYAHNSKRRKIHLGRYDSETDAAHAFDDFVCQQHLGYPLNFPNE